MAEVWTGQGSVALTRDGFERRLRNAARALIEAVRLGRTGQYTRPNRALESPRPK